jgi:crotonobetainyl-CoA:carnitine CoA-transferase CaiB-like acyl-CoA transferase
LSANSAIFRENLSTTQVSSHNEYVCLYKQGARPLERGAHPGLELRRHGPYAIQVLADLGANVIKVESPDGDTMRAVGPIRNSDMGHLYLHLKRNKRSIVLNLKTEKGREACLKLAQSCDALLYNIRPQAMARLGLSYDALSQRNTRLVYVGAYGFSESGPYADRTDC